MADRARIKVTGINPKLYDALERVLTPEKKAELKAAMEDVLAIGAEAAERERAQEAQKERVA